MSQFDYAKLYEHFGDRWIACRGTDVVASAKTYEDLRDLLNRMGIPSDLVVEYVEPRDAVRVY